MNPNFHVSFVMPCLNEAASIVYTIPRLFFAFEKNGYHLELIAVDNGSTDKTWEILNGLAKKHPSLIIYHIEENQGYGNGILQGLPHCTSQWFGTVPADGQTDADDVVRLYEAVVASEGITLGKVRRRFRSDGLARKVVSLSYNLFVRLLWPRLDSLDINGIPKLMPRWLAKAMALRSTDWLLDPEIMVKAHIMKIKILEINVFARMRGGGISHVSLHAIWSFLLTLLKFRFSIRWNRTFHQQLAMSNFFEEKLNIEKNIAPRSDLP